MTVPLSISKGKPRKKKKPPRKKKGGRENFLILLGKIEKRREGGCPNPCAIERREGTEIKVPQLKTKKERMVVFPKSYISFHRKPFDSHKGRGGGKKGMPCCLEPLPTRPQIVQDRGRGKGFGGGERGGEKKKGVGFSINSIGGTTNPGKGKRKSIRWKRKKGGGRGGGENAHG